MTSNKRIRMDNILLVIEDLKAAVDFFTEPGLEIEGEAIIEVDNDNLIPKDFVNHHLQARRIFQ